MYESSFSKLTERFFKDKPWPKVDAISHLTGDDHVFSMLYSEMYYRHVYARLQPTLEQRCESWDNYCELFKVILGTKINMQLPNSWLWDMVDDFIYQFQSYCAYRAKLRQKGPQEINVLRECDQVWNALGVLKYLQAFVDKSDIVNILKQEREGGDRSFTETDGYGYGKGSNVLRTLGYFSLVGLLRVHCLLGDYHSALQAAAPLGLSQPGAALYQRVTGCHISVYYYSGFAHIMRREYTLAAKAFNHILLYISRTKQFHTQTAAYEHGNLRRSRRSSRARGGRAGALASSRAWVTRLHRRARRRARSTRARTRWPRWFWAAGGCARGSCCRSATSTPTTRRWPWRRPWRLLSSAKETCMGGIRRVARRGAGGWTWALWRGGSWAPRGGVRARPRAPQAG